MLKQVLLIRNSVYEANFKCGIYKLLAESNFYDCCITALKLVKTDVPAMQVTEVKARIERLIKVENPSKFDSDFESRVLSSAAIETIVKRRAELKMLKQKVQDQLLELNVSTFIELSDETVEVLTREGLM